MPRVGRLSRAAFDGLRIGARVPAFWLLAASFAICGMTTNGSDRHALHPGGQRPRHADHRGGRPARDHRHPRRGRHGVLRAGSPTASIRGCCWSSTTPAAAYRCCCCRRCSRRTPSRAPGCSSSSTAWTGWRPCRRRSCCAATTSARDLPSCSAGCSHPTNSGAAVAAAGAGWLRDHPGRLRHGVLSGGGPVLRRRAALSARCGMPQVSCALQREVATLSERLCALGRTRGP